MTITIGAASYAAAAAAFLFLFLLLMTSWRGRLQGVLLAGASLVTGIWAAVLAYLALRPSQPWPVAEALEVMRGASWFAFLIVLLGYSRQAVRPLRLAALGIALFCLFSLLTALYAGGVWGRGADMLDILSHLVLAVIGLVLVEQLYFNVHPQQRWGIKFLCLGLGGMFAFDFYLYSEALLFRSVNPDIWAARGVVNAFVVPLLAVSTARNPRWSLAVSVSRRMVFHSTAILGASAYLVVMAGVGYYIRYFGGSWGVVLQVILSFGAVLLLLVVLFSGTARARLKVFLSKNFFTYRYDYREEWLRFTRTLSEGKPGVQLHERSIQAIAELVDSPAGALWLAAESGAYELAAHWNMQSAQGMEPADGPLACFLQARQWVIDLAARDAQPEAYEGLEVPAWLGALDQAWLVVPLILHERLLGFVVLARSKGRIKLDWEVNDILKTAGRQAASYLAQLEAAQALLVARQFESFNRMSAFVVHDLKNLVAQLSLLLSNADRHKHNPAFQEDMIDTVAHSVEKMKRLLVQLRGAYTLEPPAPVALDELLRKAVAMRSAHKPAPRLRPGEHMVNVVGHPARLERVMGHLIQNAIDATPPEGEVHVQLTQQNGSAVVEIADNGCGMSEQFVRYRLFRPFESTKATGMGIGMYEAQQYVKELGGRIEVQSRAGQGTVFRVVLPLHAPDGKAETSTALEEHK